MFYVRLVNREVRDRDTHTQRQATMMLVLKESSQSELEVSRESLTRVFLVGLVSLYSGIGQILQIDDSHQMHASPPY
jgi:hypothetical protein